jgi:polyisoprenoid-binding protein YceI
MVTPLLALLLAASSPGARTFAVDAGASTLRYRVVHKLHAVQGTSRAMEGKAVVHPDGRVLVMVRAAVSSFDSGDSNRDQHMQEAVDGGAHAFVVFKGVATDPALAAGAPGATTLQVTGELALHGVPRPVTVPVRLETRADGTVRATARLDVSLEAHGVERPSLLFVKIEDACRVDVDLVFREAKP